MECVARKPTLHIKVGSVKEQSPKFYFDDSQENQKIDNNPEAKKPDLAFSGIRFLLTWYTGSAENRNNRSHHEDKHCQRPNRKDHITRNPCPNRPVHPLRTHHRLTPCIPSSLTLPDLKARGFLDQSVELISVLLPSKSRDRSVPKR